MTNPFTLTWAAVLLTLTGQAPIEAWFPWIKDIAIMLLNTVMEVILGVAL